MRHTALATDYDGTLARDGIVSHETIAALERLRASGRRVFLLTGRELADLLDIFPPATLFDRIVVENGAVLYDPLTGREQLLTEPVPLMLVDVLRQRRVQPLAVSRVILATRQRNEQLVRDAIAELDLDLHVELNKGAVMVLPRGIDKATGLIAICDSLRIPVDTVVGVGDAENDLAFLTACGTAVATANALPEVKSVADFVTTGDDGDGVIELVDKIIEGFAPARI